jgi:hypothetical protein
MQEIVKDDCVAAGHACVEFGQELKRLRITRKTIFTELQHAQDIDNVQYELHSRFVNRLSQLRIAVYNSAGKLSPAEEKL